jgi:hypothetical protein
VTFRGFDSGGNGVIAIDHGGGVTTRYLHMYDSGMLVQVGDKVTGGQQIARVGSSGQSTGCHLHFEVQVNGENIDPAPSWLRSESSSDSRSGDDHERHRSTHVPQDRGAHPRQRIGRGHDQRDVLPDRDDHSRGCSRRDPRPRR